MTLKNGYNIKKIFWHSSNIKLHSCFSFYNIPIHLIFYVGIKHGEMVLYANNITLYIKSKFVLQIINNENNIGFSYVNIEVQAELIFVIRNIQFCFC